MIQFLQANMGTILSLLGAALAVGLAGAGSARGVGVAGEASSVRSWSFSCFLVHRASMV